MKRGLVLVEGLTEREVVRDVLAPHFAVRGLFLDSTIVRSSRDVDGTPFTGGVSNYAKVANDLSKLLRDPSLAIVTSMLDFYRLPRSFPGMADRPSASPRAQVEHVEQAWSAEVADPRFVPHLSLHELEAWVYAAPDRLEPWMFDDAANVVAAIAKVASEFASPEDIDQGEATSPAKRLRDAFPAGHRYQKTVHGPVAIARVGLAAIRRTCPHAAAWLDRLEKIAQS